MSDIIENICQWIAFDIALWWFCRYVFVALTNRTEQ